MEITAWSWKKSVLSVLSLRRSTVLLLFVALLPLTSCANSGIGESLEKSFAADPRLSGSPSPSPTPVSPASPNVTQPGGDRLPTPPSPQSGASLRDLALSGSANIGASGNLDAADTPNSIASPQPLAGQTNFADLDQTPKELRQYVEAVAQLGVLTPAPDPNPKSTAGATQFEPNKTITRREFARWLVAANNRINRDRSANQIRLSLPSAQPAFQDVPRTDPDFAVIQGLAETGIIPSSLSGASTTVTFSPDAPLNRETLVMWKVPLDTRRSLSLADLEAIQKTWGFQDANKIDGMALRSVLADFQNGDLANIRRSFGFTTLFQPKKAVSRAEAAAALWYFGYQGEGKSAQDALRSSSENQADTPQPAPEATNSAGQPDIRSTP